MRKCFVLKEGLYHELFYHLVTISRNAPGVLDSRIGISCSAGSPVAAMTADESPHSGSGTPHRINSLAG